MAGRQVIAEDASLNCLACDQRYAVLKHHRRHEVSRTNTHPEFRGDDRCHRPRYHHPSGLSADHPEDIQQADTCIQSPGSQRRLQTSSEVVTVHSSGQHAAEHHGNQLCVGQHGQFKPSLGGQLPAAQGGAEQRGGEPHRAVQHQQRIHCGHHTRCPIIRKHITAR